MFLYVRHLLVTYHSICCFQPQCPHHRHHHRHQVRELLSMRATLLVDTCCKVLMMSSRAVCCQVHLSLPVLAERCSRQSGHHLVNASPDGQCATNTHCCNLITTPASPVTPIQARTPCTRISGIHYAICIPRGACKAISYVCVWGGGRIYLFKHLFSCAFIYAISVDEGHIYVCSFLCIMSQTQLSYCSN